MCTRLLGALLRNSNTSRRSSALLSPIFSPRLQQQAAKSTSAGAPPPFPKSYSEAEFNALAIDPKSDGGWIKAFPNGVLIDVCTLRVLHDGKGWTERVAADGTPVIVPYKKIWIGGRILAHIAVLLTFKGLPPDVHRTSCDHVGQEGNPYKLDHADLLEWVSQGEQMQRANAHPSRKVRRQPELYADDTVDEEFRRLVLPSGLPSPTTELGSLGTVRSLNKKLKNVRMTSEGYLNFDADRKTLFLHRAYMRIFHPLDKGVDESTMVVRHLEPVCGGDSLEECLRKSLPPNICWGTRAENMADMDPATRKALHAKTAAALGRAVEVTATPEWCTRGLNGSTFMSLSEAGAALGVHRSTIVDTISRNCAVRGYTLAFVVKEHNGEGEPRFISRKVLAELNAMRRAMHERGRALRVVA